MSDTIVSPRSTFWAALLVVAGMVVVVTFGLLLARTVKVRQLASLQYLGTETNLTGRLGRFSISNATEKPMNYHTCLVEFYSNQVRVLAASPGPYKRGLQPHGTDTLEFAVPAGAKKWRGWVGVGQEKKGLAIIDARLKWYWAQLRNGFQNGLFPPTGRTFDGPIIRTEEIAD